MREIYEGDRYAQTNPTWHEEDAAWKARQVMGLIQRNRIDCRTIDEVGCGTGDIILNLEKVVLGTNFRGFEISPQAYARAKTKETARTKFFFDDLTQVPPADIDLLLIMDVIEHVEDYISFIKALRTSAKYKMFHFPLDLSVQSIVRSWPIMKLRRDVGHIHYFYKESVLATLNDCGYRIVDYKYTASRLELPNQAMSSRLMRLPRRMMFWLNQDLTVRLLGGYSLLVLAE